MELWRIASFLYLVLGALSLDTEWWKYGTIYQILLRSFQDSDGDGIGDIKGLMSRLDYLVEIGIDTVYIMPFYLASGVDTGYDIINYKKIDPDYGTMEDFEELMREMKSRGLRCITDLVINHTSHEHEWFQKSIKGIAPFKDYYVWVDPKGYDHNYNPIPPNNWFSIFVMRSDGTAWTWNDQRNQFYLHQANIQQPDLNLRNQLVKDEISDIMMFWLGKGVSGFRVDAPMIFMEDDQLRDNLPLSPEATVFTMFSECERTFNHPDTFKYLHELNVFLGQYDQVNARPIQTLMLGETYGPIPNIVKYYGTKESPAFHVPLNFLLTGLVKFQNAQELNDFLHTWLDAVPKDMPSNWALGNHDQGRVANHVGVEYSAIMLTLGTLLPGTCSLHYGEEIGMGQNNLVRKVDKYNRLFHRTPMHWDDTANAGFTTATEAWLPVHPSYWNINVKSQKNTPNSMLNFFKDLMGLRKTDTIKHGGLKFYIISEWVLAFSRTYKETIYIAMMNLGTELEPIKWTGIKNIPEALTLAASSPNSLYKKGFKMETKSAQYFLRPHSVLILTSDSVITPKPESGNASSSDGSTNQQQQQHSDINIICLRIYKGLPSLKYLPDE
ncbi:maltase A2-like [Planococcus citri]|uniref:maltase A2-like n=1 Tax=Planococcus citri TaxID=170843 RepID=UPI0031FA11F8